MQWFAVVCGGLSASSLVSLPMSQILVVIRGDVWWFCFFPVVCGGLGWFAVICGGLSFSHTPYGRRKKITQPDCVGTECK